ncbi:unnamed protein product [Strongylus vulgaris]|uniref:Uncharacterized protein n=1 Tax=Strongylus vulgaris TaxID=40348 RepID=A0A3P7JG10_STRVU|nr:unnamed protein product [Strongylus vulgaris]
MQTRKTLNSFLAWEALLEAKPQLYFAFRHPNSIPRNDEAVDRHGGVTHLFIQKYLDGLSSLVVQATALSPFRFCLLLASSTMLVLDCGGDVREVQIHYSSPAENSAGSSVQRTRQPIWSVVFLEDGPEGAQAALCLLFSSSSKSFSMFIERPRYTQEDVSAIGEPSDSIS